MKRLKLVCMLLVSGAALYAAAPVPRPAPDFVIHEPSGRETILSAQKGKVTVVQFLFTWCGHCQATAQWLSKMKTELGHKGLEVYGVAFNDEVLTKDSATNNKLTEEFSRYATFPVGLVKTKEPVLRFLGLSVVEGYGVPQMVVIDKKGVIRAQTPARPTATSVASESVMRDLVDKLLAEK